QGLICKMGECTCPNCNLANAKSGCVNNQCVVMECNVNWGDCDGNQVNGCEQNLTNDVKNCGVCNRACGQGLVCVNGSCTCPNCMRPNARTVCINAVCMFDSCLPGFGNCDNNPDNGCEVDLNKSDGNCTACGMKCPVNAPVC